MKSQILTARYLSMSKHASNAFENHNSNTALTLKIQGFKVTLPSSLMDFTRNLIARAWF